MKYKKSPSTQHKPHHFMLNSLKHMLYWKESCTKLWFNCVHSYFRLFTKWDFKFTVSLIIYHFIKKNMNFNKANILKKYKFSVMFLRLALMASYLCVTFMFKTLDTVRPRVAPCKLIIVGEMGGRKLNSLLVEILQPLNAVCSLCWVPGYTVHRAILKHFITD